MNKTIKLLTIFTLIFVALAMAVSAHQLSGRATNVEDGSGIQFVNVTFFIYDTSFVSMLVV